MGRAIKLEGLRLGVADLRGGGTSSRSLRASEGVTPSATAWPASRGPARRAAERQRRGEPWRLSLIGCIAFEFWEGPEGEGGDVCRSPGEVGGLTEFQKTNTTRGIVSCSKKIRYKASPVKTRWSHHLRLRHRVVSFASYLLHVFLVSPSSGLAIGWQDRRSTARSERVGG